MNDQQEVTEERRQSGHSLTVELCPPETLQDLRKARIETKLHSSTDLSFCPFHCGRLELRGLLCPSALHCQQLFVCVCWHPALPGFICHHSLYPLGYFSYLCLHLPAALLILRRRTWKKTLRKRPSFKFWTHLGRGVQGQGRLRSGKSKVQILQGLWSKPSLTLNIQSKNKIPLWRNMLASQVSTLCSSAEIS